MGFGPLFLGLMFLYDFQIGLRHAGAESAYALLDIFPDAIGWLLILIGLNTLSKKAEGFDFVKKSTPFLLILSLFSLAKDTLLFNTFYISGGKDQILAGKAVDFCEHLLTLAFLYLFFLALSRFCHKNGEDKLSASHSMTSRIALTEGALFIVAQASSLSFLPQGLKSAILILSRLDFLFWVFLIWYGVIAVIRTMIRISE